MRYASRKFLQAVFIQITGAFALFYDKLDGGTYVALSSLALGIYTVTNVAAKKVTPED